MKKTLLSIICTALVSIIVTSCCNDDFIIPNSNGHYIFVSCNDADSIAVIDFTTMKVVGNLTGADIQASSSEPRNSAISPDHKTVFVPCRHSNNVLVIDADTKSITHNVTHESFDEPYAVAFTPDGSSVWAVNKKGGGSSSGSISVISISTNKVSNTIDDDHLSSPEGICFANGKAYVANRGDGTVSVFNTNNFQFITNVEVGSEPRYAVSSKNGDFVYVTDVWGGLAKINTSVDTIATVIDAYGRNAAVSPDGSRVFIASQSNIIHIVSTASDLVTDINIPDAYSIYAIAITSDGSLGFATDEDKDLVYVFDPVSGALLNTGIAVGRTPHAIVAQ